MKQIFLFISRYAPSAVAYFWVGGICALIEWGTFYAAVHWVQAHYVFGVLAGFGFATFANWMLSSRLVFRSIGRSPREELLMVYLVSSVGLALNLVVTAIAVEMLAVGLMAAKIAGTGAAFALNYAGRQFVIFDRRTHRLEKIAATSQQSASPEGGVNNHFATQRAADRIP